MPRAEYMRGYREDNPEYVEEQRLQGRARNKALRKLKEKHEAEFHKYFTEEVRAERDRNRRNNGRV